MNIHGEFLSERARFLIVTLRRICRGESPTRIQSRCVIQSITFFSLNRISRSTHPRRCRRSTLSTFHSQLSFFAIFIINAFFTLAFTIRPLTHTHHTHHYHNEKSYGAAEAIFSFRDAVEWRVHMNFIGTWVQFILLIYAFNF
jgi:hypothetical protein